MSNIPNGSENKIQRFKNLAKQLELAYEGFLLSELYKQSNMPYSDFAKGIEAQSKYCAFFGESLAVMNLIHCEMIQTIKEIQ